MNGTSSVINTEYRAPLSLLHAQLSVVLRIIIIIIIIYIIHIIHIIL